MSSSRAEEYLSLTKKYAAGRQAGWIEFQEDAILLELDVAWSNLSVEDIKYVNEQITVMWVSGELDLVSKDS